MEMNELKSCEKNSLGFNFVSFFLIKLFIEIIVDLHTVLRNNTERFLVSSTQCPPKVVSSKIIVQHHNLDLDIEYNPLIFRITQFYSTHMCVCVCLVLSKFITCAAFCIHCPSQDTEHFRYHKAPLSALLMITPTFLFSPQPLLPTVSSNH